MAHEKVALVPDPDPDETIAYLEDQLDDRVAYLEGLLDTAFVALAESVGFWVAPPHQLIELPSPDSDRARQIMNVLGARPCYICGTYVLTREEGWWNDQGQAWCPAHQPVWSR